MTSGARQNPTRAGLFFYIQKAAPERGRRLKNVIIL
jgi:hypothetical protein